MAAIPQNVFMDRWIAEPKVQRVWGVPHATWFTLMGLGGGLFILGRLLNLSHDLGTWAGLPVVDLLSFVLVGVGGWVLIADLGKPFRFLRALVNLRSSWISWGAVADFVFLVLGALLVLPSLKLGGAAPLSALPWESEAASGTGKLIEGTAMLAALVVTFYAGAVLAAPRSIPYWNSPLIPAQFLLSAAAMSMGVLFILLLGVGKQATAGHVALQALFVGLLLVTILWHVRTRPEAPGKRPSLDALLRGEHRLAFLGVVVLAGAALPLILTLIAAFAGTARGPLLVTGAVFLLPQGFVLRLLTLRVGIYPPVRRRSS